MNCVNCDQFEAMVREHLRLLGEPAAVGATVEEMAQALGRTREWIERAKRVFIGIEAAQIPHAAPKNNSHRRLFGFQVHEVPMADMAHTDFCGLIQRTDR